MTGVQIHNWSDKYDDETPNLEFVAPTKVSVIIDGKRTELDLSKMPVRISHLIHSVTSHRGDHTHTQTHPSTHTHTHTHIYPCPSSMHGS